MPKPAKPPSRSEPKRNPAAPASRNASAPAVGAGASGSAGGASGSPHGASGATGGASGATGIANAVSSPPAGADGGLTDALFQLSFELQARLTRIAADHELSVIQVRLLGILRDREPGMLELARYLGLEKSSLSGLIDRAEARDLVERVPSADDRRSFAIRITARGRKLTRAIEDAAGVDIDAFVAPLSDADRARLTALLARLLPTGP